MQIIDPGRDKILLLKKNSDSSSSLGVEINSFRGFAISILAESLTDSGRVKLETF